ncbi:MAG: copper resistance system multicopper oxidase, partial [Gemmatimonadaceae bacterium]|nr:copper resistance system multicopper oxidase [Gemmatimonadaceae bacterium]
RTHVSRRRFLRTAGAFGALAGLQRLTPAYARSSGPASTRWLSSQSPRAVTDAIDLLIRETPIGFGSRSATATTINGTVPGPLLRFREGEDYVLRVTNELMEDTSIHWHGLIVPNAMDGVPGVTFPGIRPRETFTYRLPIRQYGTYWYHSHSGLQEQTGHYGPIIIDPAEPEPFTYDREYVVMLSDWTFEDPYQVLDHLKKQSSYYNFQRRTVPDFFRDVGRRGLSATLKERLAWGRMRMSPTDIADVTGATYTYLMNGIPPASNWTGLFRPGERIRLRFINAGGGTYFDVRIPGLEMTVVAVSGQYVKPVVTDEIRMEIAQTYDVIVQPTEAHAYTIFAESMDRSGYTRGTLAPRVGMAAPVPMRRPRPTLLMDDMGMAMEGMSGMDMKGDSAVAVPGNEGHDMSGMDKSAKSAADTAAADMAGHDMSGMQQSATAPLALGKNGLRAPGTLPEPVAHGPRKHGPGSSSTPELTRSRLNEPGSGLGKDGWRVLLYTDLRALKPNPDALRPPEREVEFHLTGNMERYMWSIDGVKFSDFKETIRFGLGERIRMTMVNDTMMSHPMHLHGMWMDLENGAGAEIPRVHTINVKPAERVSVLVTPNDPGPWAFHCHILFHMEMGMFRVVEVSPPTVAEPEAPRRGSR